MASCTVIVSGATGTIGLEVVRAALRMNWCVGALGRSSSPKQFFAQVAADGRTPSGKRLSYKRTSHTGSSQLDHLLKSPRLSATQPRVYVNAAGRCFYAPFASASRKDFDSIVSDNLVMSFHLLRHLCRSAQLFPRLPLLYVEIGSRDGARVGHPFFSLYAMVKQGQVGFLRSLAAEMRGTHCRFMMLSPRGVNTRLPSSSLGDRKALRRKFERDSDLLSAAQVADAVVAGIASWLPGNHRSEPTNIFTHTYL